MALLELIPKELSQIVDWYNNPKQCDRCDRFTFIILNYSNDPNYDACLNCFNVCRLCNKDAFVNIIKCLWENFDGDIWSSTTYICSHCISKCEKCNDVIDDPTYNECSNCWKFYCVTCGININESDKEYCKHCQLCKKCYGHKFHLCLGNSYDDGPGWKPKFR